MTERHLQDEDQTEKRAEKTGALKHFSPLIDIMQEFFMLSPKVLQLLAFTSRSSCGAPGV